MNKLPIVNAQAVKSSRLTCILEAYLTLDFIQAVIYEIDLVGIGEHLIICGGQKLDREK